MMSSPSSTGNDKFRTRKHELSIAVARNSQKIEGPYQGVLTWARGIGSHAVFFRRIDRAVLEQKLAGENG